MNSLVGYGVSSESDSDGGVEDPNPGGARELGGQASAVKKTRNFLLESGSASSESEPEEEDPEPSCSPPRPQKLASSAAGQPAVPSAPPGSLASHKLPPPSLHTSSDSGVFANPFKAQADRKLSALQKHVPLTMQARPSQIGGRKVCVSYRKDGRCRFGIKCKFAHDSDLQTRADSHPPASEDTPASDQAESRAGGSRGVGSQSLQRTKGQQQQQEEEEEEEEEGGQQVKKRKVGLSNTLIPPKRAMKQYATQRDREQINMS
ncbi:tau-tubulin kinase 1 [Anoplopoma fimbria]|uniref:tau-tubulin kinase 1 n=1 Tax=Anoplopoma fimbria TaxID=229290 RepID=UPI0023EB1B5D|nr:tau-tubulin kinase 1 [Anoplopoma fimbria]